MNIVNHRKAIKIILANPLDNLMIFIDEHPDNSMNSVSGRIINETKNMINLLTENSKSISISKQGGKFTISSGNLKFTIKGDILVGMAKSRSKKKYRNW